MNTLGYEVIDIEADNVDPELVKNIWVVVTKNRKTGKVNVFTDKDTFLEHARAVDGWIGHNITQYDLPVLSRMWNFDVHISKVVDTLVLSRLEDARREGGHSLEQWGKDRKFPKGDWSDWSKLSDQMVDYCKNDVELTYKVYVHLRQALPKCPDAIGVEHRMSVLCREMSLNGFKFDYAEARKLYDELQEQVVPLEQEIISAFEPNVIVLKTKTKIEPFNPASAKQVIDRIHSYWSPTEKTKGHLEAERNPSRETRKDFSKYGWTLSEVNLSTLSEDAPPAAKLFVKYRLLKSRIMKLDEWFSCYNELTGRIHGTFQSLGTWTGRMIHQKPNMANVAAEKSIKYKTKELKDMATDLGRRMRKLFICEEGNFLVGTDLAGIQLRVLANYINDKEFTHAVVNGDKKDKTDIHSLNAAAINLPGCDRDTAKTFIYAFCLGAGLSKIAQIFGCIADLAKQARERFERRYQGLELLKNKTAVEDAKKGTS